MVNRFLTSSTGSETSLVEAIAWLLMIASWVNWHFYGLLMHIKERFPSQEFVSLSHLVQRASTHEVSFHEPQSNQLQKKVSFPEYSSNIKDEVEIVLSKWTRSTKLTSCPYVKNNRSTVQVCSKAKTIFDMLLQEGKISYLLTTRFHWLSSWTKHKYYKWHTMSHGTNDYKVFCQQIQSALEQGRIRFENPESRWRLMGTLFDLQLEIQLVKHMFARVLLELDYFLSSEMVHSWIIFKNTNGVEFFSKLNYPSILELDPFFSNDFLYFLAIQSSVWLLMT